jgi:hypothetical protein
MNAKNFRDLVHYNDQPDASPEANKYRLGDKVRHESQAQEAGQHQSGANEKR